MTLTLDTIVEASRDHLASDLPDETVILNLPRSTYFGVAGVAREIWEMLKQPTSLRAVRDALAERYDVPAADVERDVFAFVEELSTHQLVTIQSP